MNSNIKNNFLFYIIFIFIAIVIGSLSFQAIYHGFNKSDSVRVAEIENIKSQENVLTGNYEEVKNNTEENFNDSDLYIEEQNITKLTDEDLQVSKILDDSDINDEKNNQQTETLAQDYYLVLKDVGEPYLDRFGLGPLDYNKIKMAGFDIIEGNFDICASHSDVLMFLEGAKDSGLKVIMTAGAGEAEWGYPCDDEFSDTLKPIWQKDLVQAWVKKWSYHPAIYAWDISNEDGQNFPNAQRLDDEWASAGYAVTLKQLQQAYRDVKEADPTRPIMIRMNGWYFYDYDSNFFRTGNAFGPGVADIVMVNAYANVDEYFSDLVSTVATRTQNAVLAINPNAKIIVSLGVWQEPPIWVLPTLEQFTNDARQAKQIANLLGISIFKYGAEEGEWWLPKNASILWSKIKEVLSNK